MIRTALAPLVPLLLSASLLACASPKRSASAQFQGAELAQSEADLEATEKPPTSAPKRTGEVPLERETGPLFSEESSSLEIAGTTWVLERPFADSPRLGLLSGSARVVHKAHLSNEDCETPWIEIEPQGWICTKVKASQRAPSSERDAEEMRRLPGSYAIATKETRFYKSSEHAEAGIRGRAARGDMIKRRARVSLDDGRTLWKTDRGEYVDASTLRHLSGSRFHGVDMREEGAPSLPFAFAINAERAKKPVPVLRAASEVAPVVARLTRRSVVEVLETSEDGAFLRIGEGRWIHRADARLVQARQPPEHVEGDSTWIDVDLHQQLVVAYRGSELLFATLASTGKGENATPTGTYSITRKKRQTTMRSDRSKKQTYSVAVPWPVYFERGFAFHSTYWHNAFGSPRSHGCVNLSPADALTIYQFVEPRMPAGWTVVYGHESQAGTAVQIRSGDSEPAENSDDVRLAIRD